MPGADVKRGASNDFDQDQDNHDPQNEADAATAVIADSRPHPIAAESERQQKHNKNDEKHEVVSFESGRRVHGGPLFNKIRWLRKRLYSGVGSRRALTACSSFRVD